MAENPAAYADAANKGLLLGFPVKIQGQDARPDNGIEYHCTIKYFDKSKACAKKIDNIAKHLPLNPPDPRDITIKFEQYKDQNGYDVYVISLFGNSCEKIKEMSGKFAGISGFNDDKSCNPHISVNKATWNKIKAENPKTAADAGIEFGSASLFAGPKVLNIYRHRPDSSEPLIQDEGDMTSKININKSEDLLGEDASLPEDEDAHTLLNRQEDKYFLPKKNIEKVIEALSDRLALGDIDTDTRYNTNRTIYLDDKDLNIFHDCMLKKKPRLKVRIRQYSPNSQGWEEVAYAEFKMKEEDGFTKKIRVRIPAEKLEILCNGGQIVFDENLVNINKDIDRRSLEARVRSINSLISRRGLKKQLEVRYERRAYTGKNLRITIDENLRFIDAQEIDENVKTVLENEKEWHDFIKPYILAAWENPFILEVKTDKGVPSWLRSLLKEVGAKEASFSKYSAAILNQIKTGKNSGDILGSVGYLESMSNLEKNEDVVGQIPLMKPYVSEAQRKWAHTSAGKKALGGNVGVHEWDEATKGKKLPEKVAKSEELQKREKVDIAVVVLKDGNFVLIGKRRRNKKWGLPGGRNEKDDESNKTAAIRELEEEAGIKLNPKDLVSAGVREVKAGGERKRIHVYTAQYPGGEPTTKNDPDEEFTQWRWVRCQDGQLPDEILDGEMTPPAEAAFDKLNMTKNEEPLQKGAMKNAGIALGMAGALAGSPSHTATPVQSASRAPASIQKPMAPIYDHHKMLNTISQVESSGGKDTNHGIGGGPIHGNERAFGKYGLMPQTIREVIKGNKDLKSKYAKALALKGDTFNKFMADHKGLEDQIADRHLAHLEKHFGKDPDMLGYAWLEGIHGAHKAKDKGIDIKNHWHVKKIRDAYGKGQ